MFLNGYPYTDFHEMNLDFLLKSMETLKQAFASFTASNSLIFAEPLLHNITSTYAKNTIVLDSDGNAYISLQNVPSGVQLSNTDYWLMVFNFEEYTEKANKNFTNNYFRDMTRAPYALSVGDWVVLNDVLYTVTQAIAADDLLVPGTNLTHFTVEQFLKDFVSSVNQTLTNWYNQMTGTINQYKNDIDASELAYRQQLAQDIANTTASLQAQLDAAISGTTVDSEVILARVGNDGVTYPTLGDAVRTNDKLSVLGIDKSHEGKCFLINGGWKVGAYRTGDGGYSPSATNCYSSNILHFTDAITLSIESGYQVEALQYSGGTYTGTFTQSTTTISIAANTDYRFNIRKYPIDSSDVADISYPSHLYFNEEIITEINNTIDNNYNVLTDFQYGKTDITNNWIKGSIRGDGVIVSSISMIVNGDFQSFDTDQIINCTNGYSGVIAYYNALHQIQSTYNIAAGDNFKLPAGTIFRIEVMRSPYDATENISIAEFKDKIYFKPIYEIITDEMSVHDLNRKGLHKMFRYVTVIGDSLSSGAVYDSANNPLFLYDQSWCAIAASKYNAEWTIAAFGGADSKTWYESQIPGRGLDLALQHPAQSYFVCLGVNDANHFTGNIGSTSDIDISDYTQNGDTFYGWYAKIIQRLYDLNGGCFFCFTSPLVYHPGMNTLLSGINAAIADIVDYLTNNTSITVTLIDLEGDYHDIYATAPISSMQYQSHYQAAAYAIFANIMMDGVDKAIYNNPTRYRYFETVPVS